MRELLPGEPWVMAMPPVKCGLPKYVEDWREAQAQAVVDILDCDERFIMVDAPVGMGKSFIAMAVAHLTGLRMMALTSTKELQVQYMNDKFPGLVLAQGRNNYVCQDAASAGAYTCEENDRWCEARKCDFRPGKVVNGIKQRGIRGHSKDCNALDCDGWPGQCGYKADVQAAVRSMKVVTNYSYWMAMGRYGQEGLGPVDLLICDEAHNAPEEVSRALATIITPGDLGLIPGITVPRNPTDPDQWQQWAKDVVAYLAANAPEVQPGANPNKEIRKLLARRERLATKCGTLISMHGEWVSEHVSQGWQIEPVWPYQHAESILFRGAGKVVLMSGTITRKTMGLLGVSMTDYAMLKYPYAFPKKNNPITHVKTVVLNKHTKPEDIETWLRNIANILRKRKDRKGIVHTVSYERAGLIMEYLGEHHPDVARMCISHDRRDAREAVRKFKSAKYPCFLISPSVTTGYDFPYEQCEFIVISKMPFPVMQTAVNKARAARDKNYSGYVMAQELVQAAGRGMRAVDDRCEVLIVDDSWFFVSKRYKAFLPSYFRVATMDYIPKPPLTIEQWRKLRDQL